MRSRLLSNLIVWHCIISLMFDLMVRGLGITYSKKCRTQRKDGKTILTFCGRSNFSIELMLLILFQQLSLYALESLECRTISLKHVWIITLCNLLNKLFFTPSLANEFFKRLAF